MRHFHSYALQKTVNGKEIDLEVYSRLNTLKFDNISFADIRDVSPFFVFIDMSEELSINLIDAGFEDD